jgi:hypothetical protein
MWLPGATPISHPVFESMGMEEVMRVRSIQNRGDRQALRGEERVATSFSGAALSEDEAARYLGMSRAWLKKSRTQRFRPAMDAPPFIRSGARRIVYRRVEMVGGPTLELGM